MVIALFAASAWAQPNPFFYQPLGQVKEFLQLSDSQVQTILGNNDEYNRWTAEKQTRIRQVQNEIAGETGKEQLDPSALGVRYAEIETICREMKDRATEYRTRNTDALNPDQKARLKVLEDALKLAPIIAEAQYGNLVGGLTSAHYAFTSAFMSIGGSVLTGGVIGPISGCYLPFPSIGVRTGSLSGATSLPGNRAPARWFDTTKFAEPRMGNQK